MEIKKISIGVCFAALLFVFGITSSVNALNLSRDLTVGSVGTDVKSLQQFLNDNGYSVASSGVGSKGRETTIFGNLTSAAVKKFQAAQGIAQTGTINSATRAALVNFGTSSSSIGNYSVSQLESMIAALKQQIALLLGGSDNGNSFSYTDWDGPRIVSIECFDEGDEDYIDKNDKIEITFSEAIDPESINDDLEDGDSVSGVTYNETGGVSVSSSGIMTIKNIVSFDVGSVDGYETYASSAYLNSSGTELTITLTAGDSIEITDENYESVEQFGGIIEDEDGNEMEDDSSIVDPTGGF